MVVVMFVRKLEVLVTMSPTRPRAAPARRFWVPTTLLNSFALEPSQESPAAWTSSMLAG